MSIQADIDATVAAFLSDLVDLVRRTALEAAQAVLEAPGGLAFGAASGPRLQPRPASKPRPRPAPRSAPAPVVAAPSAPARPTLRSLKDSRRGRLITLPSTPPPPIEQPLPVVVRVPAKMPRKPRTPRAASTPPPPVAAAEPQPARNWVVVRRPARDRREAGGDAATADAAKAGTGDAGQVAPPAPPAANGAA